MQLSNLKIEYKTFLKLLKENLKSEKIVNTSGVNIGVALFDKEKKLVPTHFGVPSKLGVVPLHLDNVTVYKVPKRSPIFGSKLHWSQYLAPTSIIENSIFTTSKKV